MLELVCQVTETVLFPIPYKELAVGATYLFCEIKSLQLLPSGKSSASLGDLRRLIPRTSTIPSLSPLSH